MNYERSNIPFDASKHIRNYSHAYNARIRQFLLSFAQPIYHQSYNCVPVTLHLKIPSNAPIFRQFQKRITSYHHAEPTIKLTLVL